MTKDIDFFIREEEHGWLSNFERTPFRVGVITYPTVEHYYQSQKGNSPTVREYIRQAPNATIAMVMGQQLEHHKLLKKYMEDDWDFKKVPVMLTGQRHKYKDPRLRGLLLETGDRGLHEANPDDPFWGKDGLDWLGRLIMQVREEILLEESG